MKKVITRTFKKTIIEFTDVTGGSQIDCVIGDDMSVKDVIEYIRKVGGDVTKPYRLERASVKLALSQRKFIEMAEVVE